MATQDALREFSFELRYSLHICRHALIVRLQSRSEVKQKRGSNIQSFPASVSIRTCSPATLQPHAWISYNAQEQKKPESHSC